MIVLDLSVKQLARLANEVERMGESENRWSGYLTDVERASILRSLRATLARLEA
jgi:hypothetical protein